MMAFNITFFIGNGFDINMGLRSSYKDFYDHMKDKYSNTNILNNNIFFKRIYNNIDDWQDFEKMMGILTCYHPQIDFCKSQVSNLDFFMSEEEVNRIVNAIFNSADEVSFDTYYSSLEFFVKEFQLYVIEQQNIIVSSMNEGYINSLLLSTFIHFWEDFDAANKNWFLGELEKEIKNVKSSRRIISSANENNKHYITVNFNFFNFNYTSTLEKMIEKLDLQALEERFLRKLSEDLDEKLLKDVKIKLVLKNKHVHATTKTGMFLGVNNRNQINGYFCESVRDEELLVKPERVKDRFPNQINELGEILNISNLVYVYGMSFGETDKMWWQILIAKIRENSSFKVSIHNYSPDKILNIGDLNYDKNIDEIKNLLLRHDVPYFTNKIDRSTARQMRSQIIPVMTSKIMFQQPYSFYWSELDAIEFFENAMFEDNNYLFFKEEFKNYSPSGWKNEKNEGDVIILSRKNIENDLKKYYSFSYNDEFINIQFYNEGNDSLEEIVKVLRVDRLTYLASEINY